MKIANWLLILLTILSSCGKKETIEPARPVKAIQVMETSAFENSLSFPGTLKAFDRADLAFRVDGLVVTRDINVGQTVKKGELLIQLDPREYEIAEQRAKGKVDSLQAQLDFASRDYIRMKNIYEMDPGAISISFLDRKKETQHQLEADLLTAKSDLDKAKDDLSYTSLKAPFDGVISAIYVENHEQILAKKPVVRLIDTKEREMDIQVSEKYITSILAGSGTLSFKVYLDAFPSVVIDATIKEIGREASSTTKTYPITLSLNDVPKNLVLNPGMSGIALLEKPMKSFAVSFKIPRSSLFSEDATHIFVWVVDPETQTVHKRAVKIEGDGEDFILVQEGLNVGDWVITAGVSFLSEGQKVKLLQEPSAP